MDLNHACVLAAAEECSAVRIADLGAINYQRVVVQAGDERWCRNRPEPIGLFFHVHFRTTPKIETDFSGVRGLHANLNSSGAVNLGKVCAPDVRFGGMELARLLCKA